MNSKGGNKKKRQANKNKRNVPVNRPLVLRTNPVGDRELQMYAKTIKILGGANVDCLCHDGIKRICKIRGSMKKRKMDTKGGNYVLIGLRDYQQKIGDIIYLYNKEEIMKIGDIDTEKDAINKLFSFEVHHENEKNENGYNFSGLNKDFKDKKVKKISDTSSSNSEEIKIKEMGLLMDLLF